jgi:hypothetical protein
MMRIGLSAILAASLFTAGCAGTLQGSATVSVQADLDVPIAKMPAKYASWVVEAEGYLQAVSEAHARHTRAMADLAAALGVEVNADAIANFIRDAIQVETTMTCTPPNFSAGLVADCSAQANARASGSAGNGGASGESSAGIQANCQAKASLSLSPGKCTMQTTVTEHPILSDAARWATIETNMQIILQLSAANVYLDGRGEGINSRGLQLHVQSVTDLGKDPSLALYFNKIQAELKRGAEATGAANDKQFAMNAELRTMTGAINSQFPGMGASVNASM